MLKIVRLKALCHKQLLFHSLAVTLSISSLDTQMCFAEEPSKVLVEVLRKEASGAEVNRSEALSRSQQSGLQRGQNGDVDSDLHWQSGEVFIAGKWTKASELSDENLTSELREYLKLRGQSHLDIESHKKFAKWCAAKGLTDQSRAHWYGVLDFDEMNAEARGMLGLVNIDDKWFTPEDVANAKKQMEQRIANLKIWMPKIQQYANQICGNNTKKKLKALADLRSLQNEEAVDAIYGAAMQLKGEYARPFIAAIKRHRSKEACLALVKFAVAYPESVVAADAINGIKEYRHEFFVPELLRVIEDDTQISQNLVRRPNGDLVLEQIMYQESLENKSMKVINQVVTLDRTQLPPDSAVSGGMTSVGGAVIVSFFFSPPRNALLDNVANRTAEMLRTKTNESEAMQNASKKEFRQRVIYVLEQSTGVSCGDSALAWWAWYDLDNDFNKTESKKYNVNSLVAYDSLAYDRRLSSYSLSSPGARERPSQESLSAMSVATGLGAARSECLIAGTLIQTSTGLMPIEEIRVGDLVLACDVESGKIELSPVLKTMVRKPCPNYIVKTKSQAICATLGHNWWVAGRGWLRTRELEPGMLLHTATGTVSIEEVQPAEKQSEVFNLIVEKNHTYFVGEDRILSNDGTDIRPTVLKAPGFSGETEVLVSAKIPNLK